MNFIVAAPPYTSRSGGVMVLHELCTALNKLGCKAGLAIITEGSQENQNYKFGFTSKAEFLDGCGQYYDYFTNRSLSEINNFINNSCIIYPDIIKGNPLNGNKFATYVLGKPLCEIISDYIIAFSSIYLENSNMVLFKPFVSEWMHDRNTLHWSQRNLSLTYFGKGPSYSECFLVEGTVLIERDWPRDKKQLAELLRNCKYFYTWDSLSATNTDALLCGAVPVFMQDRQINLNELNSAELGAYPSIKYDHISKKSDILETDLVDVDLINMKAAVQKYQFDWTNQVQKLIFELKNLNKK